MTQDKPRKIAEVEVGEGGQLRLLALREYDVICVPEHMPFTYPENPWRLVCNGMDDGGFETLDELTYYALATAKPDEVVLFIDGLKYAARRDMSEDVRRRLVAYVLRRGDMPRGKLMKILYLIDRELYIRYGYTVFRWELYKYGPRSRDVFNALDELEDADAVETYATDDALMYRLLRPLPEPPDEVKKVADKVLDTWADRELEELAEYVNSLPEVRDAWPGKPLLQP